MATIDGSPIPAADLPSIYVLLSAVDLKVAAHCKYPCFPKSANDWTIHATVAASALLFYEICESTTDIGSCTCWQLLVITLDQEVCNIVFSVPHPSLTWIYFEIEFIWVLSLFLELQMSSLMWSAATALEFVHCVIFIRMYSFHGFVALILSLQQIRYIGTVYNL